MPTIDVYAHGHSLTFLPSERAERIVLEIPRWWEHRIDYVWDQAVAPDGNRLDPRFVFNHCRKVACEIPGRRWATKGAANATVSRP